MDKSETFFREEKDRRRQSRADRSARQVAATALGVALAPPPLNFFTRRSTELKAISHDYQNGNFLTNPIRSRMIRFWSEVAAILMHRPPGGGV